MENISFMLNENYVLGDSVLENIKIFLFLDVAPGKFKTLMWLLGRLNT